MVFRRFRVRNTGLRCGFARSDVHPSERCTLWQATGRTAAGSNRSNRRRMHTHGHHHEPLPPPTTSATEAYLASVVEALGDTPETVIALQFLRDGACEVLCVGDPADLEGIVIQAIAIPEEPLAFGSSAEAIASLIPHLTGWTCVNVPSNLADDLIEPIATAANASSMRLMDDVYYALYRQFLAIPKRGARLLTAADRELVDQMPPDMIGDGSERLLATLDSGHVAGAIRDGALVSLAYTFATSERHADIGVVTHPEWRGQGLATSVASLVANAIRRDHRIPVWSCGGSNIASLRIAARLGFEEVSRRTYLIPDFDDAP